VITFETRQQRSVDVTVKLDQSSIRCCLSFREKINPALRLAFELGEFLRFTIKELAASFVQGI
jgi:hypothetical protein